MTRYFVTGGAGYIGSHTAKMLARYGHEVTVFDNLSRGHRDFVKWGPLIEGNLLETRLLEEALRKSGAEAVIHFAALAYVGESVTDPGPYYRNNVAGTLSLLEAIMAAGVGKLILSSSCATYGHAQEVPITEETPLRPINPYGRSKLMCEHLCQDFHSAYGLQYVALRYFNACGADPDGEIGERHDPETHLIPRILMAADGEIEHVQIFGDDYPTADGTCVRDYIHVCDLAQAHVNAAEHLLDGGYSEALNLGTGKGVSVREAIEAAARITGRSISTLVSPKRPGDPAELVASSEKARRLLGWKARYTNIDDMISSAWAWRLKEKAREPAKSQTA